MFWGFVHRLMVGAFIAVIVFSLMLMSLLALLALTTRRHSKLSPLSYPVLALLFGAQLYFWGMWAAYCAALAVFRSPDVTHAWLYYVVAFLFVTAPVGWLASKEQASADSLRQVRGIQRGSVLYSSLAIAAFLVFSFSPGLMTVPYGWFVGWTVPMEGRVVRELEDKYFGTLDAWVAAGGNVEDVQGVVVETCGKLVMLHATPGQRFRLATIDRDEWDYRVDVCVTVTVNRVHPQPKLQDPEIVGMICQPDSPELFAKLCDRSGLR